MKKGFLTIGTMVQVFKEADVEYIEYGKKSEKVIFTRPLLDNTTGIIVGGTYLCEGEGHYGEGHYGKSYSFDGDYDPSYLSVSKKVFVYLVRKGFINKAMKVLPEDLIPVLSSDVPFFYSNRPSISEKDRRFLRHLMSTIPRDAKGRWLK